MKYALCLAVGLGVIASAPSARADSAPTKVRRFALLIGANDGGAGRVALQYAGTDAKRFARVIRDMGGVAAADTLIIASSKLSDVTAGFADMEKRISKASSPDIRTELILYYSGHSDDTGLLLSGDKLTYKALRKSIESVPADVRVAILDSCASGAFTRAKGGTKKPAFLVDESSQVKGYAYISSSSADEVAQESDRIASSFFTHYLVSGLRGAADTNRDRKVTLSEAYQYAFHETVARTESTQGGAQHPAYNMHLAGTGDLIMTDLRSTNATLVIDSNVAGRLFIRDAKGDLVVELNKPAGRNVAIGLGASTYDVTLQTETGLQVASVILRKGKKTRLSATSFASAKVEPTVSRGAAPGAVPPADEPRSVPFRVSFVPPLATTHDRVRPGVSLNIVAGVNAGVDGIEVGGVVNVLTEDLRGFQVAGVGNLVLENVRGIQVAGAVNYAGGEVRGAQFSGAVNIAGARMRGPQVAGGVNYADGQVRGFQFAGAANIANGHVNGTQVAGALNVAPTVSGAQIGVVNIARKVEGLQLGIVNIADDSAQSIGIINAVRNGYHTAEIWASDTTPLFVGFKLGGKRMYTLLSAGTDKDQLLFGGGLGLHTPRDGYYVDIDLTAHTIFDRNLEETNDDFLAKLRFGIGFFLNDSFALFGGVSGSAALALDGKPGTDQTPIKGTKFENDDVVLRLTPGLFAGISFQ